MVVPISVLEFLVKEKCLQGEVSTWYTLVSTYTKNRYYLVELIYLKNSFNFFEHAYGYPDIYYQKCSLSTNFVIFLLEALAEQICE